MAEQDHDSRPIAQLTERRSFVTVAPSLGARGARRPNYAPKMAAQRFEARAAGQASAQFVCAGRNCSDPIGPSSPHARSVQPTMVSRCSAELERPRIGRCEPRGVVLRLKFRAKRTPRLYCT